MSATNRPFGLADPGSTTGAPARAGFPFSAVVGMDELRLALMLNAVSPAIGGVQIGRAHV